MIEEQTKIITDYVAVWGWHLLAWISFFGSLNFFVNRNWVLVCVGMIIFLICELVALRKKWRLENEG